MLYYCIGITPKIRIRGEIFRTTAFRCIKVVRLAECRDVEEMMSIEEKKYCNESNCIVVLLYCRMVLVTYVGKPKGEVGRDAVVVIGCCSYEVQEEARRERKKKRVRT